MSQTGTDRGKKPELLATARSLAECKHLMTCGADAIIAGHSRFGLRLSGDLDISDLREATQAAHAHGAKLYVPVNKIFRNEELEHLKVYLSELQAIHVDALIFGDPAVIMAYRELDLDMPLHWNAEMTSTNYATANYWGSKGARRVVLARELNLEEIRDMVGHANVEVELQVHGMTNIYHSKRKLVQSYLSHRGGRASSALTDTSLNAGLYLVEEERKELHIPIYEDAEGTHMMSSEDLCLIDVLDEVLTVNIASLKVEGLMKSEAYHANAVSCYREAIDQYVNDPGAYRFREEWLERIRRLQPTDRELSYGFLFKEQVY